MKKQEITELVKKMTLEEKASLCSGEGMWYTKGIERLGIPQIMMTDGPHGLRKQNPEHKGQLHASVPSTAYPTASLTACSWDRELLKQMGRAIADECIQEEVSIVLGPGVNIKRSPLCGRNFEYFSEDPCLAGEMGASFIKGVEEKGIGTSLKHYACNNQEFNRMLVSSEIDERTLREIYLAPFERAVKKGNPSTVMCAYNKLNGVYCSQNNKLLTDILRNEWGFDGLVMSDWGAVDDRIEGIKTGLELEMPYSGEDNEKKIIAGVNSGELAVETLDICCERLLEVIFRLSRKDKKSVDYSKDVHNELAAKIAAESAVLLKNNGLLPLDRHEKVLVIGELAKYARYQGGGSSHITPTVVTSLIEGMKELAIEFEYKEGYSIKSGEVNEKLLTEALQSANNYQKIIVYVGLTEEYEAEGFDRKNMALPPAHNRLIAELAKLNKQIAVVIASGSPIEMPWVRDVESILMMYLAGGRGGRATAELLFGLKNPCGKLAESFPIKLEDCSSYHDFVFDKYQTFYTEGLFVGYRYYDIANKPIQFPFGYGLSYTTFEYSELNCKKEEGKISVSVKIKNTGAKEGKEIVQLYIGKNESKIFRPLRELKNFEKINLKPQEEKTISMILENRDFAYYDTEQKDWVIEAGEYTVFVGASSMDINLCASVEIDGVEPSVNYNKEELAWYYKPTVNVVPFEQYEVLLGRKIDKSRPVYKKGEYTVKNSFDDMSQGSKTAKFILKAAGFGVRKYAKVDKTDSGYLMMMEMFKTTPLYKLSAASQGGFTMTMAQGVVTILNGKRIKGLKLLLSKKGNK